MKQPGNGELGLGSTKVRGVSGEAPTREKIGDRALFERVLTPDSLEKHGEDSKDCTPHNDPEDSE